MIFARKLVLMCVKLDPVVEALRTLTIDSLVPVLTGSKCAIILLQYSCGLLQREELAAADWSSLQVGYMDGKGKYGTTKNFSVQNCGLAWCLVRGLGVVLQEMSSPCLMLGGGSGAT